MAGTETEREVVAKVAGARVAVATVAAATAAATVAAMAEARVAAKVAALEGKWTARSQPRCLRANGGWWSGPRPPRQAIGCHQ